MVSRRPIAVLAAAVALMALPASAHAPTLPVADDASTALNESVTLDASRIDASGLTVGHATPMSVVLDYAKQRGMICRLPSAADLDDVFLTLPASPDGTPYLSIGGVGEVDLDTALNNDGTRVVLLACDAPTI